MKSHRASTTAKVIAASTILLASDPRTSSLIAPSADVWCRVFLSANAGDRLLAKSAAHPFTRALWRCLERWTLPGIMAHYWRRKRWIERRCREAIAQGCERVAVLGAGFDTLALRLAKEMPDIEWIEIDHPATQGAKQAAIEMNGIALPANLHLIPLDLGSATLPNDLGGDGKGTVFVLEGVLMYLQPAEVSRLLKALHHLSARRGHVIFSFMSRWPDGRSGFRPYSWAIERWLAWRSEPFTWALAPAMMDDFLRTHGFRMVDMAPASQLDHPSALSSSPLEGENLVVCRPA
jgi:methyltransferase (TIGR00027 family)